MVGGHLNPPRRRRWLAALGLVLLLGAGLLGLWWWRLLAAPSASEHDLLVGNPALSLPREPAGFVVLADPGAWARLIARDPARRPLLDPRWWSALAAGDAAPPADAAPGLTVAALSQLNHSLVVAWWEDGWIAQGRLRGGRLVGERNLERLLPQGWRGRTAMQDGVLRVASSTALADGWGWQPELAARPWWHGSLAAFAAVGGREWRGSFHRGGLVLRTSGPVRGPRPPEVGGAAVVRVADGRQLLRALQLRLPDSGLIGGLTAELEAAIERPVLLWVRRVEARQPLPRMHLALHLGWRDDEVAADRRTAAAESLRRVLCPLACTVEPAAGGDPTVERWRSPLVTWWVRREVSGVVLATGREELGALAGRLAPGAPEQAGWAVVDGPEAARVAAELVRSQLLAGLGVVAPDRLRLLRFAEPLAGFGGVTWAHDGTEHEVRVQF